GEGEVRDAVLPALRRRADPDPPARVGSLRAVRLGTAARSGVLAPTCGSSRLLYHSCYAPEASGVGGSGAAGGVPGRDPQALLRRADPRGAASVRGGARPPAPRARVLGRTRDHRATGNR